MVLSHTPFKVSMWTEKSGNKSKVHPWSSSREASVLSHSFPFNHLLQPPFSCCTLLLVDRNELEVSVGGLVFTLSLVE